MSDVAVVEEMFSAAELGEIQKVRREFPAYTPSGRIPPGLAIRPTFRHAPDRTFRFAPTLPPTADVGRYQAKLARYEIAAGNPAPVSSSYLRGTYAAYGESALSSVALLRQSRRLRELAGGLFDATTVIPTSIFANVYLPGQSLPAHTDIPAFRGAERGQVPGWLMVAMLHSGRFEQWRIPTATVVGYPEVNRSGEFYYFPPGTPDARQSVPTKVNSAVCLDADKVFHGVGTVSGDDSAARTLSRNDYLVAKPKGGWHLYRQDHRSKPIATFHDDQVRYSISWKAYCFADPAAYQAWVDHTDDLPLETIIPTLKEALAERGVPIGGGLSDAEMAGIIIEELVPFPSPGS